MEIANAVLGTIGLIDIIAVSNQIYTSEARSLSENRIVARRSYFKTDFLVI